MKSNIEVLEFAEKIGDETPDWSQEGKLLPVYNVPLNKLYYNDDNGRIATWISSYSDLENQKPLNELSLEEYNNKIQYYVKNSNSPDSYKKTLNDIRLKGQIRPGVILSDGRVVSGNRRLTVLRELYQETGSDKYGFFKCFIIDKDLEKDEDRKQIKTIERLTQFGVDEKVDYDPIARLVDIYNDLIGPKKIWTIQEYSKKLSLKVSDVELMYNKAAVMADYLKYINKENKFYIARTQKLDGPLQELARIYKKVQNHEWNRIRIVFYSCLPEPGDTTRTVRDLIKVYNNNSQRFDELIKNCINDIDQKEEKLILEENSKPYLSNDTKITSSNPQVEPEEVLPVLSDETKREIFDATNRAKIEEKRLEKVNKIFQSIDTLVLSINDTYQIMNPNERKKIEEKICEIEKVIKKFRG
jgi:predicted P-loop ATPase/GTPase